MEPSEKISVKVRTKAVTMKTPNDYRDKPRPKIYDLVTMKACETCTRTEKIGRGLFCLLTGKPCRVPKSSIDDDCLNQIENKNEINLTNMERLGIVTL